MKAKKKTHKKDCCVPGRNLTTAFTEVKTNYTSGNKELKFSPEIADN